MPFPPEAPKKIREKLELGLLPSVEPPRMWAGHGTGLLCSGCDHRIEADEIEYEFGNGQTLQMHLGCAALWQAERRRRATPDARTRGTGRRADP
jgi:hypothetical protein